MPKRKDKSKGIAQKRPEEKIYTKKTAQAFMDKATKQQKIQAVTTQSVTPNGFTS
jgi:deoxyxylulose-5-phosphate synthase